MLNVVCLMGRLAADPELRHTQAQIPVTTLRIAVDRNYQPKGQTEKITDWINVVAWRHTAEFVSKYFHKGDGIVVHGSIQTNSYVDKEGNKQTRFEVVADNVYFGERKRNTDYNSGYNQGGNANANYYQAQTPQFTEAPPAFSTAAPDAFEEILGDDDLPF